MIRKDIYALVRKGELTKIENYNEAVADKSQMWVCHHRLELTLDGEFAHSQKELERMGMYYHRPYFELIFLTDTEHRSLHSKTQSEETKKKLSKLRKGRKRSEGTKKKMSEARKNKTYSEFGKKYFDYCGYFRYENPVKYDVEYNWYLRHNKKCRWEV